LFSITEPGEGIGFSSFSLVANVNEMPHAKPLFVGVVQLIPDIILFQLAFASFVAGSA
jgi:hypothetical protein